MRRISRNEIPALHSVQVEGKTFELGQVSDFSWNATLHSSFLSSLAFSWVRLKAGEVLEPHQHPVDSAVIHCKGAVETLGDMRTTLQEGDTLVIPAGSIHGFRGLEPDGFWGLSIQPPSRGIYSNPANPRVKFLSLQEKNVEYLEQFRLNPLLSALRDGNYSTPDRLQAFLSVFQIWSDCFQELLQIRVSTTLEPNHLRLALQHQSEERGHNTQIQKAMTSRMPPPQDSQLELHCDWFRSQMGSLTDAAKTVLMHVVIEASANVFYPCLAQVQSRGVLQEHISQHLSHDPHHCEMGMSLLRSDCAQNEGLLSRVQKEGWEHLNELFSRIHQVCQKI